MTTKSKSKSDLRAEYEAELATRLKRRETLYFAGLCTSTVEECESRAREKVYGSGRPVFTEKPRLLTVRAWS